MTQEDDLTTMLKLALLLWEWYKEYKLSEFVEKLIKRQSAQKVSIIVTC